MAAKKEPSKRRGKGTKKGEDGATTFKPGGAEAPVFFNEQEIVDKLGVWYHSGKGCFLKQDNDGRWHPWTQQHLIDAMRALPDRLIAIKARENETLSEAKRVIQWILMNRAVDTAMTALPGYKMGIYDLPAGERVLVKRSPHIIEPTPGEWPVVRQIIEGMLGPKAGDRAAIDQTPWFWSLCKCWYRAFVTGSPAGWKQGHAVVFTGPAGCGKNLVQELILTALIGGRFADPLKFLMDEDQFNGDMMVEHWLLSEIPSSQRTEDRVKFAERIKQIVANRTMRARLMRSEPSTIQPFIRLSISVNDDEDTIRSLPVVSSGYGDKINIFHCNRAVLPILGDQDLRTEAERGEHGEVVEEWRDDDEEEDDTFIRETEIRRVIAEEMPHFIHWLVNEWRIPAELLKPDEPNENPRRFGFKAFHHPVIKAELFDDTPAAQAMRMIDLAEFTRTDVTMLPKKLWQLTTQNEAVDKGIWHERAETLQQLLTGETEWTCSVANMAKKLFSHNSCSRLLGRLASDPQLGEQSVNARVMKGDTRHWKGWQIGPPAN